MDVAASEFYSDKDQTYDLNFKEEVDHCFLSVNKLINLPDMSLTKHSVFFCRIMMVHRRYLAIA